MISFKGTTVAISVTGITFRNCRTAINLPTSTNNNFDSCTFFNNSIGVYVPGAATISRSTFRQNLQGISASSSPLIISNSIFESNGDTSEGGALRLTGMYKRAEITDSVFHNNFAIDANGGAVSAFGSSNTMVTLILTGCEFVGNSANQGGAISASSTTLTISQCSFTRNIAAREGGAIHARTSTSMTITDTPFSLNAVVNDQSSTISGGAIAARTTSHISVTSCDFNDNGFVATSSFDGGAIYVNGASSIRVTSCNFINNNSTRGIIYLTGNTPFTIDKSRFERSRGGAIAVTAASATLQESWITQTVFEQNTAAPGYAAAVSLTTTGPVTMDLCTISSSVGKSIYVLGTMKKVKVISTNFFDNNAPGEPGTCNFDSASSSADFTNCTFERNHADNGAGISGLFNSITNCRFLNYLIYLFFIRH